MRVAVEVVVFVVFALVLVWAKRRRERAAVVLWRAGYRAGLVDGGQPAQGSVLVSAQVLVPVEPVGGAYALN